MAVGPRRTRRRPIGAMILLGILILSLGWVLYLRVTDQPLRDPFGFYEPAPELPAMDGTGARAPVMPPAEGKVRILISAREIPAYSAVGRDDLFDQRRGVFAFLDLDEEFVEENGVLRGTGPIIGRVLKRTKRPGFAFTEDDFLPRGTRPGLVGGIPAGMRAMRIDVKFVEGIIGLNPGDRFDLVAASRLDPPKPRTDVAPVGPELFGAYSEAARARRPGAPDPTRVSTEPRSRVDVIVNNGIVVSPLETRLVPTSSTNLMSGQVTGTRPVQEMVIALAPESVAPLQAAMVLESRLTCVARSGRPDDDPDSVTPGLAPEGDGDTAAADGAGPAASSAAAPMPAGYENAGFAVVETIVGGRRELTAVPKATGGTGADGASARDGGEGADR